MKIPILMVGGDGRIRRFTPTAGQALHLIPSDIGRPITDISSHFRSIGIEIDLGQIISEVTESGSAKESEVQDHQGHWYRLQIRPYRTLENRIDGVVIAFIDIDILKRSLKDVSIARGKLKVPTARRTCFSRHCPTSLTTPLTTIFSWAQMLRMGRLDAEKSVRAAEIIEEERKVQAQLINDLLDVSRIVMGKLFATRR